MPSSLALRELSPRQSLSAPIGGRPAVPSPYSSAVDVRKFLAEFLLCLGGHTEAEALAEAWKMSIDGKGLYDIPGE